MNKEEFFTPENRKGGTAFMSPSGKFSLSVFPYKTKEKCWDYTEGLIYNSDGKIVARVLRNYSSFPFLFVEDHPKGNFLICGSNYQGQTVVNLDTGETKDNLSDGSEQGHGFCWSTYNLDKKSNILIVEGCYWGHPYEYKFYNFSDPMNGWPELDMDGKYADSDEIRPPKIRNNKIYCFASDYIGLDEYNKYYDTNDNLIKSPKLASVKIFKIDDNKLVLEKELVSKAEQKKRDERKEAELKYNAWKKHFEATDPLYSKFIELEKDPVFNPEKYLWSGRTHEGWCPDYTTEEKRWGKRVYWKEKDIVTIQWALETGPVKVEFKEDAKFFEHSVEGMIEAFEYAKTIIKGLNNE